MKANKKRLTILSDAERSALYDSPDFTQEQRQCYFDFEADEMALIQQQTQLIRKMHCALQLGYFKAKQLMFKVHWDEVKDDVQFVMNRYFPDETFHPAPLTKHQYYSHYHAITKLFGYRMWSKKFELSLIAQSNKALKIDTNPQFIVMELLKYIDKEKIIRPGHSTLQTIISDVLLSERNRLDTRINKLLSEETKNQLANLIVSKDKLSQLAELKLDAKDFKVRMMDAERKKLKIIEPLYKIAKSVLPMLELSKHNIAYYAELIHYYTIHDLRERIKPNQTYLYLLCYLWKRYLQLNDNLIDAGYVHLKQTEKDIKAKAKTAFTQHILSEQRDFRAMKRLARLFITDEISDECRFGEVREQAFKNIIPKDELENKVNTAEEKSLKEIDFQWQQIDEVRRKFKLHLRPLMMALNFSSTGKNSQWLEAIKWLKKIFNSNKKSNTHSKGDVPEGTLPKRLERYLLNNTDVSTEKRLLIDRYEFWVYRNVNKCIRSGHLHLEDSLHHRSLQQELDSCIKSDASKNLNVPIVNKPIKQLLNEKFSELHHQWVQLNNELSKGKLKHLRYDTEKRTLHLKKTENRKENVAEKSFYDQLPLCDISDVLRIVNEQCNYSSAFIHIQPRYAKIPADSNCLNASILAQALNNGNFKMAEISNIPYDSLRDTYQSRLRLQTLKKSNDIISNNITTMPIFPYYSIDLAVLYGGVDGQKYEVDNPTIKARYSKKYFRKGKGLVAYTILSNHIPLQVELIGAHEHESYFAFDIWYNNSTNVTPEVLTGDMHIINKANFGIMDWFGGSLYPRFTDFQSQLKHLYCGNNTTDYEKWMIKPVGVINSELIEEEWLNIKSIIIALGAKEMTQSTLVKKLCNYTTQNRTRKAVMEYDKLIRSIYTLNYFRDHELQRNVHKSQNRIESYHQLRAAIANAYGRKELSGKTDREIEISNQCGRLIANAIIHYNSLILSKLQEKYEAQDNKKALALLKKISPVAWQHINFHGHLNFSDDGQLIDIEAMVDKLILKSTKGTVLG